MAGAPTPTITLAAEARNRCRRSTGADVLEQQQCLGRGHQLNYKCRDWIMLREDLNDYKKPREWSVTMSALPTRPVSLAEFEALPEKDGIQELLDGEVIEMPPPKLGHSRIIKAFERVLLRNIHESRVWVETGFLIGTNCPQPDVAISHADQREDADGLAAPHCLRSRSLRAAILQTSSSSRRNSIWQTVLGRISQNMFGPAKALYR